MDRKHRLLGQLPLVVGGLVGLALVAALIWFIYSSVTSKDEKSKREVQVVQVIRPPPPPPDEPPPPPPEEKIEEPIEEPPPEDAPTDEPAPSEQLGLDADGTAGGDAFGLAARKGGRDLAGSGGAAFAWYTGMLRDRLLDRLTDDERVRAKRFAVVVSVWVAPDGTIREAKLASSSGNRDVDAAIVGALGTLGRLRDVPPLEMPQPINLRVVSRT